MDKKILINDFAIRSFREVADYDYIAARMAYRAQLVPQFLWSSLQAIEKYLKCILLLNRIKANRVRHDLSTSLDLLKTCAPFELRLQKPSRELIEHLDTYGRFRYLRFHSTSWAWKSCNSTWLSGTYGVTAEYSTTKSICSTERKSECSISRFEQLSTAKPNLRSRSESLEGHLRRSLLVRRTLPGNLYCGRTYFSDSVHGSGFIFGVTCTLRTRRFHCTRRYLTTS